MVLPEPEYVEIACKYSQNNNAFHVGSIGLYCNNFRQNYREGF